MVRLSFIRDERGLRDLPFTTNPALADAGDIRLILMRQLVVLEIDSVEVLRTQVPLFCMAGIGRRTIEALQDTGHERLEIPEGSLVLLFSLDRGAGVVSVQEEGRKKAASCSYDELLDAWLAFESEARDYLVSEFPGLLDHPELVACFRGESSSA